MAFRFSLAANDKFRTTFLPSSSSSFCISWLKYWNFSVLKWNCEECNIPSASVRDRKFLDQLSSYQRLLKTLFHALALGQSARNRNQSNIRLNVLSVIKNGISLNKLFFPLPISVICTNLFLLSRKETRVAVLKTFQNCNAERTFHETKCEPPQPTPTLFSLR
jgi:hypothetical protein